MFTLPPDPYKILGISKDAQLPDIKAAYRKLILKCHPDKVQDAQLKAEKQVEFQRVQEAYELLADDIARSKYDEKVRYNEKYGELEKEREKTKMSSSPPTGARTPRSKPSYYEPEIRSAEPRPSSFTKTGTPPSSRKFYEAGYASSRSWDDEVGSASRAYEEMRRSKKPASYERERERDREREREWEREREHEREREKQERRKRKEKEEELARERERERLKQELKATKEVEEAKKKKERREKDKDKKKSDKERKRDVEDKHRRHKPYAEPYHEDSDVDDIIPPVFEKKSSSGRKSEDAIHESTRPTPTTERERKNSANLESAIRYLERSGAKPALSRSPTFQDTPSYSVRHVAPPVAAPTPPPATTAIHPPPPPPPRDHRDIDVEEDGARRSSGRSSRTKPPDALRPSARESRDKSSHRKSGTRSASRDAARPSIVEVTPGAARIPPQLQKSYTDPHKVVHLHRSHTETSYPRPPPRPAPRLERTHTWQQGDDRERGRGLRITSYSDEDTEDDAHFHRHSRRTQSPEPMTAATTHRYAVADGKARRKYTAEAMPIPTPRSHKVKHVPANTSSLRADPGTAGYYPDEYVDIPHAAFSNVKYAPVVKENEVLYSTLPRQSSSYTKEPYIPTAVYGA